MKAVLYRKNGSIGVLELVGDAPMPKRKGGHVLVKVVAASLNPVDWKIRLNSMPTMKLPKTTGSDMVGIVEQSDANSKFKKGDKVYALLPMLAQQGGLSEYVVVKEGHLAKAPSNLSFEECACLPLVGCTVVQSFEKAGLSARSPQQTKGTQKTILIHAGAGGVGSFAIQYAKQCGLKVFTTCSTRNLEFVKDLGADVAIDYTTTAFEDVARDMDFVMDVMGGAYELRSMKCIKSSGIYLNIMNSGWATKVGSSKDVPDGVTAANSVAGSMVGFAYVGFRMAMQYITGPYYKFCVVNPNGTSLDLVTQLCEKGVIRPIIDSVYSIDKYRGAFSRLEEGHARGKVIVSISNPLSTPKL